MHCLYYMRVCRFVELTLCQRKAAGWQRKARSEVKRNEDLQRTAGTEAEKVSVAHSPIS